MNSTQIAMETRTFRRRLLALLALLAFSGPLFAAQPLFWSVSRDGETVGHLLGTIHSEDPRVLEFSEAFLAVLTDSRLFAMELKPDLPTLSALAARMRLPEGQSLEAVLGTRRFGAVAEALAGYGVPLEQVRTMQPWAALMTLSVPPPRTGLFLDFSLSLRASGAGVKVVGLETLDQQLAFLEGMPLDDQLALLDQAVIDAGRVQDMHDEMLGMYLENDLERLYAMALEQLQSVPESARRAFVEQGIDARNGNMLASALPYLEEGGAFIAVGAMHLAGETGLVEQLRQAGYVLEPAGWPFIARP